MKKLLILLFSLYIFAACNDKKEQSTESESISPTNQVTTDDTTDNFFPVTSYLKGEIYSIKNGGITPVRKITIDGKTDSSWLKMETLDTVFANFLSPIIDTSNLKKDFQEKKFLDQTLNAFTFTYARRPNSENAFAFVNWDVYVDPETNNVKRIYLLKKVSEEVTLQLTWQSGKWCKIVTIKNNKVVKEDKTIWSFDE